MKEGEGREASDSRLQKLEILESVLQQYQEPQFKIMGNILLEIQRAKMYSLRGCRNLREYVLKHHAFQWRSARRYMNAVRVMDFLAGCQRALPTSEKQVRCLALCSREEVNAIWAKAVEIAEVQSIQITANLVKGIKVQICQEVDPAPRGPRPWQDEYSQPGNKRPQSNGTGGAQDGGWEFTGLSSDDDGDSDEEDVQPRGAQPTHLKLKWGRKRSRHHGYSRVGASAARPQSANPQAPAPRAVIASVPFQPPTPSTSGQPQSNPAMSYPSIPLPPAGPLAMSDLPIASAASAAVPESCASMPPPGVAQRAPGAYVPGTPGVEAAAMDLMSMRQGPGAATASLTSGDVVMFGEEGARAGEGGGC
ncbi:unnamed protein product [Ostreobium quekettii]|uniref:Uncharacterized protein n=1 Tax=Ostreobium quekettii TaxID=121088 RepID=A0A8S1J6B9_9CHLO|nr:unnamed protein product [Ostreobium quekettii]|eukprot:evm.model.scf_1241.2 EVM.evm.TU.scf_1241.2   scf_1241:20609-25315(-)